MDDKSSLPDVEKTADSAAVTHHPMSDSKTHDAARNNTENDMTSSSQTRNIALADVVDWEGEDDPVKPMNW
jgi:hypothetical protein